MTSATITPFVPSETKAPETKGIKYTRQSVRNVVLGISHILSRFSDKRHQGLREPGNEKKIVPETGVMAIPRVDGRDNLIGFQFFMSEQYGETHTTNNIVGIVFDLEIYERIGEAYVVNMLRKLSESIRESSRPSDKRLLELSRAYLENN